LGNGGDELLLNTFLAFGGPGRKAVIFNPTFSVYRIYAKLTGTELINLERDDDFKVTDKKLEEAISKKPDIVFLCNPNNPTGTSTPINLIEQFVKQINGVVLLDEAYGEFANFSQLMLAKYPNVGVLKTFSKAYSLASLRVGYMIASQAIVDGLMRVKLPYNLSALSMKIAKMCLENDSIFKDRINLIKEERARLVKELKRIDGINVYPSQANYIYFQLRYNSKKVFEGLLDNGVLIRPFFNNPRLENGLRVTVGSPEQNDAFLRAISQVIKEL
jgi:histidinol-phosphate aminotransferase